jgi:hypothetical protein
MLPRIGSSYTSKNANDVFVTEWPVTQLARLRYRLVEYVFGKATPNGVFSSKLVVA